MKRISNARLGEMEAGGAKIHRLQPKAEAQPDLIQAILAMQQQNNDVWQQTIAGLSSAISSVATTLKPEPVIKEVPVEVPTYAKPDYQFSVNRDKDGLVTSVDLMDGERKAGIATFNRDKDYRVTNITTRSV